MNVKEVGFKSYKTVDEALKIIFDNLSSIGIEEVSIYDCFGRILAEDIFAPFNVPSNDRSAMDGYAVKAEDTFGASLNNPAILRLVGKIGVDEVTNIEVKSGEAVKVFTGSPIPKGANAVVMLEHTKLEGEILYVFKSLTPFKNVSRAGEDIKKGEKVLKKGEILQPQDVGVLASLGFKTVKVYKKPKVAVISTGNELLEVGEELKPGKIYNSNLPMICNALAEFRFESLPLGIAKDKEEEIEKKLLEAISKCDAVIFTGGTSVGSYDLVPTVVEKFGKVLFHGVNMKPGMPTAFGIVNKKPVFMLPGSPVACLLSHYTFVIPALYRMMGVKIVERKWSKKRCTLKSRIPSEIGIRSNARVLWEKDYAESLRISGSGILSTMVKANALLVVPEMREGFEAGEEVEVTLIRDMTEVVE